METIWKPVKGYEDRYLISNHGEIFSILKKKVLTEKVTEKGYLRVRLYKNGYKNMFVHRIVAQTFIKNCLNKQFINHKDCNKQNNSIGNLEWVTYSENNYHAKVNNLYRNGHKVNTSKLTIDQVREIKNTYSRWSKEFNGYALAKKYNVHHTAIYSILSRKNWKYIN